MTHALTERAMIMNLSVGIWQGYRLDRDASRKVTDEAGAAGDAARVNKHIVPKEALAPIVTATSNVRNHYYARTLPWRDNGDRIISRLAFTKFVEEHAALVRAFDAAVDEFITNTCPDAIAKAEFRMGDLFDISDYPRAEELRRKFYVSLDIDAVTTSNDFRVQVDQEHVDKIKAGMDEMFTKRLQSAQADVWRRIGEAVGRFHERMSQPDAKFRAATVDNVVDLIDEIPGLNVMDDPDIEAVRRMIKEKLLGADVEGLRKDPEYRSEMADEAKEIIDRMSGFMKAFGGK